MSAGRQLYRFVMERQGKAFEAKDWDSGAMANEVKETWEKEASRIASFSDNADEHSVRTVLTGAVTIVVDVGDEVRAKMAEAVDVGISHAFRHHKDRLGGLDPSVVIGRANSAALDHLFLDEDDHPIGEMT